LVSVLTQTLPADLAEAMSEVEELLAGAGMALADFAGAGADDAMGELAAGADAGAALVAGAGAAAVAAGAAAGLLAGAGAAAGEAAVAGALIAEASAFLLLRLFLVLLSAAEAAEESAGAAIALESPFLDFDFLVVVSAAAGAVEESAGAAAAAAASAFLAFFDFLVGAGVVESVGGVLCVWAKPKLTHIRIKRQKDRDRIDFRFNLFTDNSPRSLCTRICANDPRSTWPEICPG
jgi:hypothetical protein